MRKMSVLLGLTMLLLAAGWLCPVGTLAQEVKPRSPYCPGLGYQTDRCECKTGEKCSGCPCNPCSADKNCACITAVRSEAGSLKGEIKVVKTKVKTKGPKSYKDVIVYLEPVDKKLNTPVPCRRPVMDQKGLVFIPHVMAVQKGTTVDFLNDDEVDHNIFCQDDCCKILEAKKSKKPQFMDLGNWGKGEKRHYTFNLPGEAVLLCKLHPEMAAYMVVLDTPYFTTAKIDGETQSAEFALKNIPPGKYLLKTWNKKCVSEPQEITVSKGETAEVNIDISRKKRRRR